MLRSSFEIKFGERLGGSCSVNKCSTFYPFLIQYSVRVSVSSLQTKYSASQFFFKNMLPEWSRHNDRSLKPGNN